MEPIAVDVVLRTGDPQHFTQGRSWRINPNEYLEVLDANGNTIAIVAEGRWDAVGYRYTPPVTFNAVTRKPSSRARRLLTDLIS
jgi:hypothetical protein